MSVSIPYDINAWAEGLQVTSDENTTCGVDALQLRNTCSAFEVLPDGVDGQLDVSVSLVAINAEELIIGMWGVRRTDGRTVHHVDIVASIRIASD